MRDAPVLLLFALCLSWPRFSTIFRSAMDGAAVQSPLTLAASAVSISSLGLAIADQGAMTGSILVLTGVLAARLMPGQISSAAVIASCASLLAYLQLVDRIG